MSACVGMLRSSEELTSIYIKSIISIIFQLFFTEKKTRLNEVMWKVMRLMRGKPKLMYLLEIHDWLTSIGTLTFPFSSPAWSHNSQSCPLAAVPVVHQLALTKRFVTCGDRKSSGTNHTDRHTNADRIHDRDRTSAAGTLGRDLCPTSVQPVSNQC